MIWQWNWRKFEVLLSYLGETFGDVTCLAGLEKTDLMKLSIEKSPSTNSGNEKLNKLVRLPICFHSIEFQSNTYQQPSLSIEPENELPSTEPLTVRWSALIWISNEMNIFYCHFFNFRMKHALRRCSMKFYRLSLKSIQTLMWRLNLLTCIQVQ